MTETQYITTAAATIFVNRCIDGYMGSDKEYTAWRSPAAWLWAINLNGLAIDDRAKLAKICEEHGEPLDAAEAQVIIYLTNTYGKTIQHEPPQEPFPAMRVGRELAESEIGLLSRLEQQPSFSETAAPVL